MGIAFGLLKFQIFFGVLGIPDISWGWKVDAGPEPTYEEKLRVPPPPPPPGMLGRPVSELHIRWGPLTATHIEPLCKTCRDDDDPFGLGSN